MPSLPEPGTGGSSAGWLLALGAALGIAMAVSSLLTPIRSAGLPGGTIAQVNGVAIYAEDYRRAIAALAADRRDPIDDADRERVLDRIIDEELLVQHALQLGLARSDRRVRADLVSAVIDAQLALAGAAQPDESELREFYRENVNFFARSGRVHVRRIWISSEPRRGGTTAPSERAQRATARLRAGDAFAAVRRDQGDRVPAPIPDVALPETKLREYLGPSLARAAAGLATGEISNPIAMPDGFHVFQMIRRTPGSAPEFGVIRSEVALEFQRQAGGRALRDTLEALRAAADLTIAPPVPQ
jgi:parvulin-like peptidyl-prolyl isomerase